ncbi:MAG: hypothetical protein ACJAVK_001795 [Akkermansiaceae bacterium]|jgi:hypothetical protein
MNKIEFLGRDESLLTLNGKLPEIIPGEDATLHHFIDGSSGQKLHNDIRAVLIDASVINGDDVRMLD